MMNTQLKNIVAFSALMSANGGILDKSPTYIIEKFEKYAMRKDISWHWGLDEENTAIVREWIRKWDIPADYEVERAFKLPAKKYKSKGYDSIK